MKDLDSHILREIGTLSRCIHSISDLKFKEINLQKGQFTFLTRICENQGINQIDLSNLLKVDKTTTTKAIQKLIEAGYIDKKRDDIDKRMWRLYPKEKALEVYTFIIEEENRNIEACFKNFNSEEKELVSKLVKKMRENIESDWKEIKNF
ncbi:MarR family transcriptional regulator [Clostridium drakei]|uniref:MarR family transcriptional regulator n=2 Tax=Clostridium TaxID=1485 RepID=A0A2U8DMM1_9CLOT|nr:MULTISPECIES: MarR family transcriptional regulator [Clostridium]AWI03444.1 MarR family transcriptional regulator [Clostridium drakei]